MTLLSVTRLRQLLQPYRGNKMYNKEPSQRQLQVGQEIKKIIASMVQRQEIRNIQDVDALVTIMEAQVSPDLKYCNVYFITSDADTNQTVLEGLMLARNYIRKQVGARAGLRYVPELVFRIDESFARVDEIERLLRDPKVSADLQKE